MQEYEGDSRKAEREHTGTFDVSYKHDVFKRIEL